MKILREPTQIMFSVFKERRRLASIKAERQREREREREKGTLDTFAEASLTAGRGGGAVR